MRGCVELQRCLPLFPTCMCNFNIFWTPIMCQILSTCLQFIFFQSMIKVSSVYLTLSLSCLKHSYVFLIFKCNISYHHYNNNIIIWSKSLTTACEFTVISIKFQLEKKASCTNREKIGLWVNSVGKIRPLRNPTYIK